MSRLSALLCLASVGLVAFPVSASEPALNLQPYFGRVVYLDFWASWCVPCRQSFAWMMEQQAQLAEQGLTIVTVNVDRDRKAADRFLAKLKCELPVIYDPDGKIAAAYQLEAMPSSFIYGRDGTLRASLIGFEPEKTAAIEAQLRSLLAEELGDAQAH